MTQHDRIASSSENATTAFLREILERTPTGKGDRSAALTGALYGVIRTMHALRNPIGSGDQITFRAGVIASTGSALAQLCPTPAMASSESTDEAFLAIMADGAARVVQDVADVLHDQAQGGPCCPMSGIVPGIVAGAVYVATEFRDRAQYPQPADVRPFLMELVDAAIGVTATVEAAEAMGEAQGNG